MLNLSISICIIILLFLVPGALFRKAYNSVRLSDYHNKASTLSEIVLTIALSVLIQFLALACIAIYDFFFFCPYQVDFHSILAIISINSSTDNAFILKPVEDHFKLIFLYQMIVYAFCVIIARISLGAVINLKLDQANPFLRFDNEWHYILTGRVNSPNKDGLKYANVLVHIDDAYIIYTGFLADYHIGKDGNLKLIEMERVKKKVISKNSSGPGGTKEHPLVVDSLFIPYENIKNFSITYYDLDPVDKPAAKPRKKLTLRRSIIFLLLMIIIALLAFIIKLYAKLPPSG